MSEGSAARAIRSTYHHETHDTRQHEKSGYVVSHFAVSREKQEDGSIKYLHPHDKKKESKRQATERTSNDTNPKPFNASGQTSAQCSDVGACCVEKAHQHKLSLETDQRPCALSTHGSSARRCTIVVLPNTCLYSKPYQTIPAWCASSERKCALRCPRQLGLRGTRKGEGRKYNTTQPLLAASDSKIRDKTRRKTESKI